MRAQLRYGITDDDVNNDGTPETIDVPASMAQDTQATQGNLVFGIVPHGRILPIVQGSRNRLVSQPNPEPPRKDACGCSKPAGRERNQATVECHSRPARAGGS